MLISAFKNISKSAGLGSVEHTEALKRFCVVDTHR
jgi:hypothetical protein